MTIAGGGGGSASGTPDGYRMSYSVAAMVSAEVAMTANSAHGAHHGHDKRFASSLFAMSVKGLQQRSGSVESIHALPCASGTGI